MLSFSRLLLAAACAISLPAAVQAQTQHRHATAAEAQAMLDRAVAELKSAGPKKAFAEFNQAKGPYNDGELYVFVLSMKGVYEAYSPNPAQVGKDVHEMKDAEGTPLVQNMIELAQSKGHGDVRYVWLNRADNEIERKWTMIERVGDHIVGVGYHPN